MADRYLNSLLGDNEQILLQCRQHWSVFVRNILVEGVLILGLVALVTSVVVLAPLAADVKKWVYWGYLQILPVLVSLIYDLMKWWNRKYVITDHRGAVQ